MSLATTFQVARDVASRSFSQSSWARPRSAAPAPGAAWRFAELAERSLRMSSATTSRRSPKGRAR